MNIFSTLFLKAVLFFFPAGTHSFLRSIPIIGGYFARMRPTVIVPEGNQPQQRLPRHPYAQEMLIEDTDTKWTVFIPGTISNLSVNNGTCSFDTKRNSDLLSYCVTPNRLSGFVTIECKSGISLLFSEPHFVSLKKNGHSVSTTILAGYKHIQGSVVKISYAKQ